ncbi:MAG: glycosyltransferase family 2 protein [Cellvibrionaceae bacterium]
MSYSVVIPAKNEAQGLKLLLPKLSSLASDALEIIVVNDGSTDNTLEVVKQHQVKVVTHQYAKGNGAAIKAGARVAKGDVIVFMDADGQHDPKYIADLLAEISAGADMAVGARDSGSQASVGRMLANQFYNKFASWMTGFEIRDLTSGFRAVRRERFLQFLYLLPNGFSYPTTSTMAFFRSGFTVVYIDIKADERIGKSHLNIWKDGIKFLLIIFKIGTLFSPMKLFFPISILFFMVGAMYYGYTYIEFHRFTNMSAMLFSSSVLVFLMGLVSEQVSALHYKDVR